MTTMNSYRSHPLNEFLNSHKTTSSKDASLTGMGEKTGRWLISDEEYPKFYDLLHDYLFVKKFSPLNLVEQPRVNQSKPLMIDIDFHYSLETNKIRKFSKTQVHTFVKHIAETVRKFYHVETFEVLRFFITQRRGPYREGNKPFIKDGVHILCPDIALINEKQKVIRSYILQQNFLKNTFENTGYINSDKEVYDESMTRKQGWFPYGESKPSVDPYLLDYVFTYDPVNDEWDEEECNNYNERQLLELLSVRYNVSEDNIDIHESMKDMYDTLLNGYPTTSETTEVSNDPIPNLTDYLMVPPTEQERNIIERLVLECLSDDRADNYELWMRVGWCLHNIDKSEEMFNLWIEFSRKSSKFRDNDIGHLRVDFFHKMRSDGPRLTERSLHSWAKKDNPELYKKIIDESIYEYIKNEVDGTHYHIAKLLKKIYKNNYVASINNRDTDWYYYDDTMNMWKHLNQGIQLKTKISTEVAGYIANVGHKYSLRACDERISQSEREVAKAEIKRFQKIQNCLFTNGFVESSMKMAETVFSDEDFTNKLNKDPYLFACKNGVIQLRAKVEGSSEETVVFRPGIPEDYLSFLAGYNFPEHDAINYMPYDEKNPVYKEIFDFFDKIFPNRELRDYFLRLLASCLEGMNREQCYYTWEGVGGNGKSKVVELMRLTFGDYQTSLQSTVLTRKRPESGAANPDIMAIKNRRFIYLQEPDDKEPLNTSRMKQFSGEDMVEARGLFKDQEKFKVTGKLNMMCNSKPIIRTMDRGTWRRIRVIPFESKFVAPDDPEYISKRKNVFLRDNELDKKLVEWREPFLSLLVHIYKTQYLKNGLEPTPDIVKQASEEYKESNDSFAKFESERIRKVEGEKITFRDIEKVYKKWVEVSGGSARRLNSQELLKRVNDEYGTPNDGKYYYDRKVFYDDDEVDMFDNTET